MVKTLQDATYPVISGHVVFVTPGHDRVSHWADVLMAAFPDLTRHLGLSPFNLQVIPSKGGYYIWGYYRLTIFVRSRKWLITGGQIILLFSIWPIIIHSEAIKKRVVPHFETVTCYFCPLSPIISQLEVLIVLKILG